jgi:hypothetical protein
MRCTLSSLAPLAVVAGLAAAVPAGAQPTPPPPAHAAGGDVVTLTYPSLVTSRVRSTRRALKRATALIEDGQRAKGATALKIVRTRMAAAWRGARYVVRTTPPPPADEARDRADAHAGGGGPVGPTKAGAADTAFLVLTLQHDVGAGVIDLLDADDGTSLTPLGTTLRFALAQRDRAIRDIRAFAPPAPADEARVDPRPVHARASGDGPTVATFDTVMPSVTDQLDDELQAIDGVMADSAGLTAGGRQVLNAAATRVTRTKATVNKVWPPVPAED